MYAVWTWRNLPYFERMFLSLLTFIWQNVKNKNQLDATYYFIVLLIGSTCFGHYYAHHQELTTIMSCFSLQPGHYSSLTAPNLQPTANQEWNDQCGNQHHSHELLMMGIVVPETCWAYKKHNKIISSIWLVLILQLSQWCTNQQTSMTKHICIQSWSVVEIMTWEKYDLFAVPYTVCVSSHVLTNVQTVFISHRCLIMCFVHVLTLQDLQIPPCFNMS